MMSQIDVNVLSKLKFYYTYHKMPSINIFFNIIHIEIYNRLQIVCYKLFPVLKILVTGVKVDCTTYFKYYMLTLG